MPSQNRENDNSAPPQKRKRKSRWTNDEMDKTFIPGMPTTLPANASEDQREQYLLQLQIEDTSRRLRSGDLGIPANPEERSPSPEPIYNNEGKRMNTREYRVRKALEEERHEKIQKLLGLNANYKPPADYKPPVIRVSDKVVIPQDDHPDINFVGLLIGPRGNTLKNLEKETGAKIIIRGKGSVKEGKIGRKDGQPLPGEDEPLHAYITANDPDNVKNAVERIHQIIKEGIEVPEENNDLRKQQLRELALLNGTLRDNDGLQKLRQIAEAQTIVTNTIICSKCGGAGHIAKDCVQFTPAERVNNQLALRRGGGELSVGAPVRSNAKMDSEYMSLMAELGQVAPGSLKADIEAQISSARSAAKAEADRESRFSEAPRPLMDIEPKPAGNLSLSADYGYGGRRSRFEDFGDEDNHGRRFDDRGPRSRFDDRGSNRFGGRGRFDNDRGNRFNDGGSRFDQGPANNSRFDMGQSNNSRFDQGNSSQNNRFDQSSGGHSRFDQGPPGPASRFDQPTNNQGGWNNVNNQQNSWGMPAPPAPPTMAAPAPPPPMGGMYGGAPPPPPPTSNPWQSNSGPAAPWQQPPQNTMPPWQQSNFSSPAAPPPPPTSMYGSNGYGGFTSTLPPPPPPQ